MTDPPALVLEWHNTSTTPPMKPIETRAYGHRFRSRLEARWAVAFTEARIDWRYEPEGFDLGEAGFYLPDFWLPQVKMWAEVKPDRPTDGELEKAAALANQSGWPCLLLIGPPAPNSYWAVEPPGPFLGDDWKVLCGQVAALAMDYCPFEGSDYHLDSPARFYVCAGDPVTKFPMPFNPGFGSHPAVEAALSARFEHGESPQ